MSDELRLPRARACLRVLCCPCCGSTNSPSRRNRPPAFLAAIELLGPRSLDDIPPGWPGDAGAAARNGARPYDRLFDISISSAAKSSTGSEGR